MSNSKKRLRKGEARIQFIACQDLIRDLRDKGYDLRMIYERLRGENRITMSYSGFYDNVSRRRSLKGHERSSVAPNLPAPARLGIALNASSRLEIAAPLQSVKPASKPAAPGMGADSGDIHERRRLQREQAAAGLKKSETLVAHPSDEEQSEAEKLKEKYI